MCHMTCSRTPPFKDVKEFAMKFDNGKNGSAYLENSHTHHFNGHKQTTRRGGIVAVPLSGVYGVAASLLCGLFCNNFRNHHPNLQAVVVAKAMLLRALPPNEQSRRRTFA